MDNRIIDFYFSLRSPYSWLACRRIDAELSGLPVSLRWIHGYPEDLDSHPMGTGLDAKKLSYLITDVSRFADRYGLEFKGPPRIDVDWPKVDAAFWYAESKGLGPEFAKTASAARFESGLDLEEDATLRQIAVGIGLDGDGLLAAADRRTRVIADSANDPDAREKVFGVPTFVYRGELFWGNDRIEWLARAVRGEQNRKGRVDGSADG